jgi:hypothetical protein
MARSTSKLPLPLLKTMNWLSSLEQIFEYSGFCRLGHFDLDGYGYFLTYHRGRILLESDNGLRRFPFNRGTEIPYLCIDIECGKNLDNRGACEDDCENFQWGFIGSLMATV